MTHDLEAAALFRQRAEELRSIAKRAVDLHSRQALWDVARDYERKAREQERQTADGVTRLL